MTLVLYTGFLLLVAGILLILAGSGRASAADTFFLWLGGLGLLFYAALWHVVLLADLRRVKRAILELLTAPAGDDQGARG